MSIASLLAAHASGCGTLVIPPDLDSGISGIILAGPQCPVEMPDRPECDDQPFQGTVVVRSANGLIEVTRFTADSDGRFRVPLFPGTYCLDPMSGRNGFPFAAPQTVEVRSGEFIEITILYDTGIR